MQLLIIENNPILEENFTNQLSFDKKINFSYYSNINIIKEIILKKEFDFIIALGVVYTHNIQDAIRCLKEIQRVGKGKSFITLASYENKKDFWLFKQWSLLGTTILHKEEWLDLLKHAKYSGDYFFTNAKYLNLVLKK